MIIDSHAHICEFVDGRIAAGRTSSSRGGLVQMGDGGSLRLMPPLPGPTRFPAEVLLEHMDHIGVDRAVLLQGSLYGDQNDLISQTVANWPDRFTGAAFLDPLAPGARRYFARIRDDWGFKALKLELSEATGFCGLYPDLDLASPDLAWLWGDAAAHQITITLDLGGIGSRSYQTAPVRGIAERHPDLHLVIAHLAQPPLHNNRSDLPEIEATRLWEEQLSLARLPNVWFDLAALPYYAEPEEYPYPSVRAVLRRAVELVGSERLLWGTDAPALLREATYRQLLDYVVKHCDFLSPTERAGILGENARTAYRISV
jgi:hypothetical protein